MLVLTDTFSGWPDPFPCRINKAREVTKVLLQEVIPRCWGTTWSVKESAPSKVKLVKKR